MDNDRVIRRSGAPNSDPARFGLWAGAAGSNARLEFFGTRLQRMPLAALTVRVAAALVNVPAGLVATQR